MEALSMMAMDSTSRLVSQINNINLLNYILKLKRFIPAHNGFIS